MADARTTAHRLALDHVLHLISEAPCANRLVLRGSAAMCVWAGDRAREPGDLDWVVRPVDGVPRDERDPYPYLDDLDPVRLWPEVAHGAGRPTMWEFEDLTTGGLRAHVPPEGLSWVSGDEVRMGDWDVLHDEVLHLIERSPSAGGDVRLDPAEAAYSHLGDGDEYRYAGIAGLRIVVPWHAPGLPAGTVQLDFAYDEPLPEPPVPVLIPRPAARRRPTVIWTASRALSLAWKLTWLVTDQATLGVSAGKDLYDAALLAEPADLRLSRRLRSMLPGRRVPTPDEIRAWNVTGDASHRESLAAAVARLGHH
ncbi:MULTISPECIES: nucleotidyl transferase AbiEii/AbiGii toxin family protein [Catenuloplanes]|uniref:Nucleotidyltransferase AbiEii toxin of type IV toxin-antitoxin system n=1 Tax=Catenuloplanes niger TaxID=587534 RepID=A0AAE3ZP96_9ACTN|nr:nucleotidyl transferase AbiEii/AbiGii toxin family protein [Catenuloplanes niger]MDR7323026.1 hypothetical protein [Catenuloplanes niger]